MVVKMRFPQKWRKTPEKHKKLTESGGKTSAFGQNFGPSDRVRTCGLMVPNHPRYQLRHTRLYLFFSQFPAYWLSAIRPRRFPQKHSRGSSLGSLAPLLVSSPRSNAFIRPRRRHSSSPSCATPGYIYFLVSFLLIGFLILIRGASLRNIVA